MLLILAVFVVPTFQREFVFAGFNWKSVMMPLISIATLLAGKRSVGDTVSFAGWIRTRRDSKAGFSFLAVHDGSCFDPIQVIVEKELSNYEEQILKITSGCSVKVTGELVPSPAKGQAYEIKAAEIEVLGWVDEPETYPMQPKRHTMEHLREYAHLRPRTNIIGALARVRHAAALAVHNFFDINGFVWVNTPIITASDCEGAGEMFRVSTLDLNNLPKTDKGEIDYREDFFAKPAFLTVSGQLNAEAYCLAMNKVYTFGPTFRAENSNTSRHLAEFWMIEPEIAFADLSEVTNLAERMLKHVCAILLERRADDMAFFEKRVDNQCIKRVRQLVEQPFVRMPYTKVIDVLLKAGKKFEYPVSWGIDLQSEHERFLAEEYIKGPVVVIDYPEHIKSFYMRLNDDNKTVAAMDVLAPGIGEIIGGSQREERLKMLDNRMQQKGLDTADYGWYRDLRRYGTVPHAGFGLGFERLLSYLTGVANVRDVIPFPRLPRNVAF